jgi:hypothetical protein
MPDLLFAVEGGAPAMSYPWWVTNALVPAAISVLGSLLTLLVGMAAASRKEWYRRLSTWEPYGEQLRLLQIKLYGEICQTAPKVMRAASNLAYHWKDGEPEIDAPLDHAYKAARDELDPLGIQARILLAPTFNEVYTKFDHKVFMLATANVSDPKERPVAKKDADEMYSLFGQLLEAARIGIDTDALGTKTVEAIVAGIKEGETNATSLVGGKSGDVQ